MKKYLSCIKRVKGTNEPECRDIAKSYLTCRMDRNLMAKDEFKNLGFSDEKESDAAKKNEKDKVSHQGELRW